MSEREKQESSLLCTYCSHLRLITAAVQLFLKFVDPETAIASSKTKWKGTENNRNILAKKQNIVAS